MKINGPPRLVSTGSHGRIPVGLALAAGSCLAALALIASPAKAQPSPIPFGYQIDLTKLVNGASPSVLPTMSVQITDIQPPGGGVSIFFDPTPPPPPASGGLLPGEFITKVGLNLTQALQNSYQQQNLNPFAGLVVSCEPVGSGVCDGASVVAQVDAYSIEGAAVDGFDLGFDFALSNNGGRLTNDQTVRFNLTGTALTAKDLLGTVTVNGSAYQGDVNVAAKVQGIAGGGSLVIGDPPGNGTDVPGPLPILGAAAAFQASRRLRRRLKPVAVVAPRSV